MRIVYMGTPEIAATIFETLLQGEDEVVLCVTQPDRPSGRGNKMTPSPVKEVAVAHNIPVFQPEKIREAANVAVIREAKPDMVVVAAFGQILPKELLDIPPYGCINVHASLLPKYRGAAPIQWSIIDGEAETGITIMYMAEGLDTGDMIYKQIVPITAKETGGSLHNKLAIAGGEALMVAMEQIKSGTATREPQGEMTTPYAKQLRKDMGRLDFTRPAEELERLIRGLNPWPSAFTFHNGKQMKIWQADVVENPNPQENAAPGEVLEVNKNGFVVATGEKALLVTELQLAGKQRMKAGDFLRGYRLEAGEVLGDEAQ